MSAGAPRFADRSAPADWDDAYANGPHIPGADGYPGAWAKAAADFRAALGARAETGLRYQGPLDDGRERFDLFRPDGEAKGLAVFIHGGYWQKFGREIWSHLAAGAVARGWAVAVPGYTLAPGARLSEMTLQMAAFLETAAQVVGGPIALSGHSAGGHLASRLLCEDVAVPDSVRGRVARVVSISGLHDLRPLRFTKIGEALRLQPGEATAESPALHRPVEEARLLAWVGEDERPEFLRQAELIANIWAGLGAETRLAVEPGRHHFDVIAGLSEPDSPLTEALLGW